MKQYTDWLLTLWYGFGAVRPLQCCMFIENRIYECMLQRLRDKFPNVRIQAVLALGRLQDPHDSECPIING